MQSRRAAEKETAALQLQEARKRAEEKHRDLSLEKMALERLEHDVRAGAGKYNGGKQGNAALKNWKPF